MENQQGNWWLTHSYVGVPTVASGFVLGLLLLVFRDLDSDLRARFISALVVYVLGLAILAFVYFDLDVRNCRYAYLAREEAKPQPPKVFWSYVVVHGLWLGALIGYLFWRGIL